MNLGDAPALDDEAGWMLDSVPEEDRAAWIFPSQVPQGADDDEREARPRIPALTHPKKLYSNKVAERRANSSVIIFEPARLWTRT